jgi:hypothetical protein
VGYFLLNKRAANDISSDPDELDASLKERYPTYEDFLADFTPYVDAAETRWDDNTAPLDAHFSCINTKIAISKLEKSEDTHVKFHHHTVVHIIKMGRFFLEKSDYLFQYLHSTKPELCSANSVALAKKKGLIEDEKPQEKRLTPEEKAQYREDITELSIYLEAVAGFLRDKHNEGIIEKELYSDEDLKSHYGSYENFKAEFDTYLDAARDKFSSPDTKGQYIKNPQQVIKGIGAKSEHNQCDMYPHIQKNNTQYVNNRTWGAGYLAHDYASRFPQIVAEGHFKRAQELCDGTYEPLDKSKILTPEEKAKYQEDIVALSIYAEAVYNVLAPISERGNRLDNAIKQRYETYSNFEDDFDKLLEQAKDFFTSSDDNSGQYVENPFKVLKKLAQISGKDQYYKYPHKCSTLSHAIILPAGCSGYMSHHFTKHHADSKEINRMENYAKAYCDGTYVPIVNLPEKTIEVKEPEAAKFQTFLHGAKEVPESAAGISSLTVAMAILHASGDGAKETQECMDMVDAINAKRAARGS